MNILFLTLLEIKSINDRNIYTDLLRELRKKDHNIYVISPYERRLNKSTECINEEGINFLKVKIGNIQKINTIEKVISTLLIEHQYLRGIERYFKNIKFDLVIYSTPPITFYNVIRYIKERDNAKLYLLLKDIFPQNAVDLGMFSNRGLIYNFFRKKEINLYKISDYIGCMSQANVDFILKHNEYLYKDKVEICPNSIEPLCLQKNEENLKSIRIKYKIPLDKTVFIYGGNLGKPQGIDFVIECLKSNIDNEKVFFIIVGSGTECYKLHNFIKINKPGNIKLFSQLPKKDYDMLVNACDVGLIFLDKRFTIPNFPSRMLSYMEASMPVLAATDINSDIGQVVENGEFGLWCESGNIESFNDKLYALHDKDLRLKMGKNSRKYLEKNYTSEHSYKIIMGHFKKVEEENV